MIEEGIITTETNRAIEDRLFEDAIAGLQTRAISAIRASGYTLNDDPLKINEIEDAFGALSVSMPSDVRTETLDALCDLRMAMRRRDRTEAAR